MQTIINTHMLLYENHVENKYIMWLMYDAAYCEWTHAAIQYICYYIIHMSNTIMLCMFFSPTYLSQIPLQTCPMIIVKQQRS